jgi:hypothetical protein
MMVLSDATPAGHRRDLAEVFTLKILKLIPGRVARAYTRHEVPVRDGHA